MRIQAWPPLYSLLLAGVQSITGVSVFSVTLATALLYVGAVLSWHVLFRHLAIRQGGRGSDVLLATGWAALILVHHTRGLRSEALLYLLIPWIVLAALRFSQAGDTARLWRRLSWLLLVLLVGIAIRQSAVIFAAGSIAVLLCMSRFDRPSRVLGGAVIAGTATLGLWGMEAWLGILSRQTGFGFGEYSPLEYLDQLVRGIGRNQGETTVGLLLFGLFAWMSRGREVSRSVLLFTGVTVGTIYILFNLTSVTDQLRGRMTLFASLLVVGNGLLVVPAQLGRPWRWLLVLLLVGFPAVNVGKYLVLGRGPAVIDLADQSALERFLPANAMIDKGHLHKPPLVIGSKVVVSPPLFPWIEHRLKNR